MINHHVIRSLYLLVYHKVELEVKVIKVVMVEKEEVQIKIFNFNPYT